MNICCNHTRCLQLSKLLSALQIYNPEAGGFADLGVLDVTQIFGRAGRPQFDTSGEGIIITTHDKLPCVKKTHSHLQKCVECLCISGLHIAGFTSRC